MAEEIATMGLSLDEPGEIVNPGAQPPAEPPAEPAQPPPAAAAPPPAEDDADPEGTIAAATGEKYVPLSALQAERGKRKESTRTLTAKETEIAGLKQKAQLYDEAAGYIQQAKPYIDALRANPGLVQQIQQPPKPQEPAGPLSDAEAVEYAKDFDLYTPDGKPDVARAQKIASRHDKMAERRAQQMVAPLVQNEVQRTSAGLYQQMLSRPEVNGVKVDATMLAEAFNTLNNAGVPITKDVAEVLFMNTIGRQILSGHKPTAAPPPPLVTEGVGAGRPAEVSLNSQSERMLSASGIKRDTFMETRNGYKPGQHNSLE